MIRAEWWGTEQGKQISLRRAESHPFTHLFYQQNLELVPGVTNESNTVPVLKELTVQ